MSWSVGPHRPGFMEPLARRVRELDPLLSSSSTLRHRHRRYQRELAEIVSLHSAIKALPTVSNPVSRLSQTTSSGKPIPGEYHLRRGNWFAEFEVDLEKMTVVGLICTSDG